MSICSAFRFRDHGVFVLPLEEAQKVEVPQGGLEGLPRRGAAIPPPNVPSEVGSKGVDLPDNQGPISHWLHLPQLPDQAIISGALQSPTAVLGAMDLPDGRKRSIEQQELRPEFAVSGIHPSNVQLWREYI